MDFQFHWFCGKINAIKHHYILIMFPFSIVGWNYWPCSPFFILCQVGVDNMCILVNAVKRQPLELPLEGRISNALVEVGPSITLASLSEVLAFAVGSFIPMPACRVFSMFAGSEFLYLNWRTCRMVVYICYWYVSVIYFLLFHFGFPFNFYLHIPMQHWLYSWTSFCKLLLLLLWLFLIFLELRITGLIAFLV